MKTREQIIEEVNRIKADEGLKYPTAQILANAPLALVQLALEARLGTLQWVLDGGPLDQSLTHQEKIQWMAVWAAQHHAQLELQGTCGFGRECVGILVEQKYPDYEWYDANLERIDGNGEVWTPEDAYHKHPCVAVLGRGENVEAQLYEWLRWFDANGFTIETGDNAIEEWKPLGIAGVLLGKHRYARMVRAVR